MLTCLQILDEEMGTLSGALPRSWPLSSSLGLPKGSKDPSPHNCHRSAEAPGFPGGQMGGGGMWKKGVKPGLSAKNEWEFHPSLPALS